MLPVVADEHRPLGISLESDLTITRLASYPSRRSPPGVGEAIVVAGSLLNVPKGDDAGVLWTWLYRAVLLQNGLHAMLGSTSTPLSVMPSATPPPAPAPCQLAVDPTSVPLCADMNDPNLALQLAALSHRLPVLSGKYGIVQSSLIHSRRSQCRNEPFQMPHAPKRRTGSRRLSVYGFHGLTEGTRSNIVAGCGEGVPDRDAFGVPDRWFTHRGVYTNQAVTSHFSLVLSYGLEEWLSWEQGTMCLRERQDWESVQRATNKPETRKPENITLRRLSPAATTGIPESYPFLVSWKNIIIRRRHATHTEFKYPTIRVRHSPAGTG
ncbi:hypothetical protein JB92DRAFT_3093086 [Gautieria morchelliformis]|nr:hypothetical protein JB92DRAFT_3093086 [Gautieria morchelliformis]